MLHNIHAVYNEINSLTNSQMQKIIVRNKKNTDNYELKVIFKPDCTWIFNNSFPNPC